MQFRFVGISYWGGGFLYPPPIGSFVAHPPWRSICLHFVKEVESIKQRFGGEHSFRFPGLALAWSLALANVRALALGPASGHGPGALGPVADVLGLGPLPGTGLIPRAWTDSLGLSRFPWAWADSSGLGRSLEPGPGQCRGLYIYIYTYIYIYILRYNLILLCKYMILSRQQRKPQPFRMSFSTNEPE